MQVARTALISLVALMLIQFPACTDNDSVPPTAALVPSGRLMARETFQAFARGGRTASVERVVSYSVENGRAMSNGVPLFSRRVDIPAPDAVATPRGSRRVVFRSAAGVDFEIRLFRTVAGEPTSRIEVYRNGVLAAATGFVWRRHASRVLLTGETHEHYSGEMLSARTSLTPADLRFARRREDAQAVAAGDQIDCGGIDAVASSGTAPVTVAASLGECDLEEPDLTVIDETSRCWGTALEYAEAFVIREAAFLAFARILEEGEPTDPLLPEAREAYIRAERNLIVRTGDLLDCMNESGEEGGTGGASEAW